MEAEKWKQDNLENNLLSSIQEESVQDTIKAVNKHEEQVENLNANIHSKMRQDSNENFSVLIKRSSS